MTIGDALARFRQNTNLSQKDIAKKLGMFQSAYSRYEQGITMPSAAFIIKLADAYDVSTDYLLGRSEFPILKLPNKFAKLFWTLKKH